MLPQAQVDEVRRLLAEGRVSQRRIARQLGISRSTVGLIASGRRPDRPPPVAADDDPWADAGPPQRCPTCGGMVYVPCRLCRVRELKRREAERYRFRRQWLGRPARPAARSCGPVTHACG